MTKYTALDADPGRLNYHERNFVDIVRKYGWHNTSVGSEKDDPGFCYTTGFWLKFKFPELIVFSLRPQIVHDTFWYMYRKLAGGGSFPIGEPTDDIFENVGAVLLPVMRQHSIACRVEQVVLRQR